MTRTTNARLAGFMFLFYIASGIAGMVLLNPGKSAEGTAAKLANIAQHATLTRVGAVFSLLMMMNAFVLGVALYALTREYDRDLALLALSCRLTEGVIAAVGAVVTQALLMVATSAVGAAAADAAAANALGSMLLKTRGLTSLISATVFAIGSMIFSYLFLRARSIPVSLAWLGVFASILLVVGLPLQIAGFIGSPVTSIMWIPMAAFEVPLGIWLLINPHFSHPLVARTQSVARMRGARREADEGVVETTSRRPNERNEADGPQSASAAERVGEMRVKGVGPEARA